MSETWTFALICTDRDKHPPTDLHRVDYHGPLEELNPDDLTPSAPRSMYELDCSACPRNERWRHARVIRLAQRAISQMRSGQQTVEVDLSKL